MEVKDLQTVLDSLLDGRKLVAAFPMHLSGCHVIAFDRSIALVRQELTIATATTNCNFNPPCSSGKLKPATASTASCLNDAYHKSVLLSDEVASIGSAVPSCRLCGGCHDSIDCSR